MYNFHFLITLFLVYSFVVNNFIASTKTNFKSNISDFRFKVIIIQYLVLFIIRFLKRNVLLALDNNNNTLNLCVALCVQGVIIIHEVYEEGAASKDGRLWAGDQILEVNLILPQTTFF